MKVIVLDRKKNELRIEVAGEGHTFCNALQQALLRDQTVEFVGYRIPHPLVSQPIILIRTKGARKPEEALIEAAKRLGAETEGIRKSFEEAVQKTETVQP